MPKLRTFVAVSLSGEVRAAAKGLIESLSVSSASLRWVAVENLHWTLKFLGEVQDIETPKICREIADAVHDMRAFEIEAHGAGAFPNPSRPRTVWLGAKQGEAEMIALHQAVEEALLPMGFGKEGRRFRPHITLGRTKNARSGIGDLGERIAEHADASIGRMRVNHATVFASERARRGPIYTVLARAALAGG